MIRRWAAVSIFAVVAAVGAVSAVTGGSANPAEAAAAPSRPLTHAQHSALEMSTVAACLRDKGWKITVGAQGGIGSEVGFDEAPAYDADFSRCNSAFLAAHPRPVMDAASWTKLYKHQLLLRECLRQHGYPPVQKVPSMADYVAAGRTPMGPEFYAWSAVGGVGTDELAELERDCPQAPPDL